jgi:hypothetical protein
MRSTVSARMNADLCVYRSILLAENSLEISKGFYATTVAASRRFVTAKIPTFAEPIGPMHWDIG